MTAIGYFKAFRYRRGNPTVSGYEAIFTFGKDRASVVAAYRQACAHKYYLDKHTEGGSRIAKYGTPMQYGEWSCLPDIGRLEQAERAEYKKAA